MSNIKDYSNYLEEAMKIKIGEKVFMVNEKNGAYLNFKKEMKKINDDTTEGNEFDTDTNLINSILNNGLGKSEAKELLGMLSIKDIKEICSDITEAWMGQRVFHLGDKPEPETGE